MRKFLLVSIVMITMLVCSIFLHIKSLGYLEYNKEQYEYFKDEKLIDVDGKVNLSSVKKSRDDLVSELNVLFEQMEFSYDDYLKILDDKKNNNVLVAEKIESLSLEVSDLEERKSTLNSEYGALLKKYEKLRPINNSVSSNSGYNFPLINQYPNYPTGCESVALTMLLKYYGINVTVDDVIRNLKKSRLPYYENGVLYGGNLEVEFVGNPYSKSSYGVYEKPVADVANIFKEGINVRSEFPFSEVVNLVKNGKPVVAWASMGMALPYISASWIYKPTMETIYFKANEHAVVIIDVTDNKVVIADPMGGKIKSYSRSLFEQRYNYFGRKALYY